ncbi:MAG: DNA-directed DNA polymerase II small subunit [Candidatus Micrarchaeota archaeon]|nr:DNA-directed DNA polymerase II small subunit [Candidatus Micrarchaeota archaeon]
MRLTKDAINLLQQMPNKETITELLKKSNKPFLTKDDVMEAIKFLSIQKIEKVQEEKIESYYAENISHKIEIIEESDVSGKSRSRGTVEDFISYFNDRFSKIKNIFLKRGISDVITTKDIKNYDRKDVGIICFVYDIRQSSKGNTIIEFEDEYGTGLGIIVKENLDKLPSVIQDDIILIKGRVINDMIIIKEIEFPDISLYENNLNIEEDFYIAYLSDIHVGSKKFLEKNFNYFIEWLTKSEEGKKVAYMVIAGDIVDGIGIYPKQEDELIIKDIDKQYETFNELAKKIPEWIKIIAIPGNHDAVRRAEPQPSLNKKHCSSSIIYASNPVYVKIHSVLHLVYHGTSMDSIIAKIPKLNYDNPALCMQELLKRRHLSPFYGDNLVVPEKKDYLVIETVPHVFHTGHLHKNAYKKYRNCLLINSGTFQDRTDYQIQLGHVPTPGIVPIFNPKRNVIKEVNTFAKVS